MDKIISLARQIESLNTELLNNIKAEISKVDWKTESTKSLIFENPLPYYDIFGDEYRTIFIHEISNVSDNKNSLRYRYKIDNANNNIMFNDELYINENEGVLILYAIAKHLKTTNVYSGHMVRYDSPSEKLGLMWEKVI